jgi:hypothetical protein
MSVHGQRSVMGTGPVYMSCGGRSVKVRVSWRRKGTHASRSLDCLSAIVC